MTMTSSSETTDADLAAATAALNLYSQRPQPEETPEFLSKSQSELLEELDKLPDEKKAGWLKAKEKCPTLVGEVHRLMFLRCELFNAELAALRIGKYWNRRIELFGENRSFKPLHLGGDGALSSTHSSSDNSEHDKPNSEDEDMVQYTLKGLYLGFIRPTETHDAGGRVILFIDPSRLAGYDKNNNDERLGVARALWYVLHNLIEGNDSVQKLGMIAVVYPHHFKKSLIDRKLMKMNMESISGCVPIRMGGFHICHPPWFFGKIIFPIMKMVMPERMRKRVRVHSGSEEKVLGNLKEFGLSQEVLPSEIGGDVILDTDLWIQEMKSRGL
mmetsp:Transcript_15258/g.33114  ORF Transcript_15258/g.33114 Transcript_15258/m.33114 type:complete len:329 (-) Transcript_15258:90-1076(-)